MARPLRIVVPGAPHHVTQRGNRREAVFRTPADFVFFLDLLAWGLSKEDVELLAYCLMRNHSHLICVPGHERALSRLMQRVGARYAKHVNATYGWTGHIWEQRFHSAPMQDRHAVAAGPYVLRNPVAAGLVDNVLDWPYSSAHDLLGVKKDRLISGKFPDLMLEWRRILLANQPTDESLIEQIRRPSSRPPAAMQPSVGV